MEYETKITSLIEFIKEDRTEIREIRNRMYSTIQLFVIASIAITAFCLDNDKSALPFYLVDVFFLLISWGYFFLTKRDLSMARRCLKGRQDQLTTISMTDSYLDNIVAEYNKRIKKNNKKHPLRLKQLITVKDYKNNLFLDHSLTEPDIKDNELFVVIGIASVIYIALGIGTYILIQC